MLRASFGLLIYYFGPCAAAAAETARPTPKEDVLRANWLVIRSPEALQNMNAAAGSHDVAELVRLQREGCFIQTGLLLTFADPT